MTRETGDEVLITDATRDLMRLGKFEFDERPSVPLKGKRERRSGLWVPRPLIGPNVLAATAATSRVTD